MPPKKDIGWNHGEPINVGKKKSRCNYCGKIISGGVTRLKQHVDRVIGQVDPCPTAPQEISKMLREHLSDTAKARENVKRKKEMLLASLREDTIYGDKEPHDPDESDEEEADRMEEMYFDSGYNMDGMSRLERKQLRQV